MHKGHIFGSIKLANVVGIKLLLCLFFVCSLSSLYYLAVCSYRDLILYTITVGKITAVQAPCYIYRRQNYKHNSNSIPKTFANLIVLKMWPLCMARNGGPSPVGLGPQLAPNTSLSHFPLGRPSALTASALPPRCRGGYGLLSLSTSRGQTSRCSRNFSAPWCSLGRAMSLCAKRACLLSRRVLSGVNLLSAMTILSSADLKALCPSHR